MTDTLKKYKKSSAMIALALASSSTFAADLGVANDFSALVFEEYNSKLGRADGPIAAGEIKLKGGYSVGYRHPSNPDKPYLISESSIEFKYGRQFVGGMIAGGGASIHRGVRYSMERGAQIITNQDHSALPFSFDKQEEYYKKLSTELAQLEATGDITSKWGGIYLTGDGKSTTQVFNVDAHEFARAYTFKVKDIPTNATVIFNITGDDDLRVRIKSFARLRKHATKTVFNFPDAQKLNIKGSRWEGVILAPNADVSGLYGVAVMPIIAESFSGSMALLGNSFDGNLPEVAQPIEPFAMQKKWHWDSSDFMPEFNQVMATPVVVQLNDDNGDGVIDNKDVADVVVVTFKPGSYSLGVVRALSGISGNELWDYSEGAIIADASYSPAAADFDGDGIVEVVVASRWDGAFGNGIISVIDNNGVIKKQIDKVNSPNWLAIGNIDIADIDNDGSLELTLGDAVYNYDTGALFKFDVEWSPSSIFFDSNNDGVQEVLARGQLHDINGAVLWSYTGENPVWFSSVADIDNDKKPEVILSIPSAVLSPEKSRIVALEHNGNIKWVVELEATHGGGAQAISNFLGANDLGIVHAGYTAVTLYDKCGQLIWAVPNDDEWSGKLGVSAYDFNGDGIDEVIVQDNFKVRVLNGLNGEVLSTVANSTASLWEYPIVVDLEGDNNAELIVVSNNYDSRYSINNGVTVFGAADNSKPWKNATRIWNQHSYHQTNISQDGKVPVVELPSWLNNNSYRSSTLK